MSCPSVYLALYSITIRPLTGSAGTDGRPFYDKWILLASQHVLPTHTATVTNWPQFKWQRNPSTEWRDVGGGVLNPSLQKWTDGVGLGHFQDTWDTTETATTIPRNNGRDEWRTLGQTHTNPINIDFELTTSEQAVWQWSSLLVVDGWYDKLSFCRVVEEERITAIYYIRLDPGSLEHCHSNVCSHRTHKLPIFNRARPTSQPAQQNISWDHDDDDDGGLGRHWIWEFMGSDGRLAGWLVVWLGQAGTRNLLLATCYFRNIVLLHQGRKSLGILHSFSMAHSVAVLIHDGLTVFV